MARKILFLLCLMVTQAHAQVVVKGHVEDLKTNESIGNAVIFFSPEIGATTDSIGAFAITLPDTATTLRISAVGYETETVRIRENLSISLRPDAHNLGEVVVSGTLREMQKSESPIPIETYSNKYFKKNPTPNLFEGLATLNGVQPQLNCNICNTGDIHINGMEGPYTMVLIDGMPIVSSLSTVYGLTGIPISLIKRIEVVKGPASTLYGSEAVAGLINVITQDPASAARFSADVRVTSRAEGNMDLGGKWRIGRAYSLLGINSYYYGTSHDVNGDYFTDITQQRRLSVFNKWSFDRKNDLPASLAMRFYTENRWGGEMDWNESLRGSDQVYAESIKTNRVELFGNYGFRMGSEKVLFEYSYNYHHQDAFYGAHPYDAIQHTAFAQLRWEKDWKNRHLLIGIPFRYIQYDDNTPATADLSGRTMPSYTYLPGVFAQDEWNFAPKFTLLTGLRYERHNVQGNIFSPRIALKWEPVKGHIFRLNGGNGFRVVNLFTEDHLALSGARDLQILETLKPERSWNGTLNHSATYTPSFGYITLDANVFYTYFTNRIQADYDTDPQKIIYRNLNGHAVSRGFSLNVDIIHRNGLKALLGATFLDSYVENKDANGVAVRREQLFAPKASATWVIGYNWKRYDWSFDYTGKLFGPQRLPTVPNDYRADHSPWFALANVQATKKCSEKIEVYGAVQNLFNFFPANPILHSDDPFDRPGGKYFLADGSPRPDTNPYNYTFDPSYNYAPLQGIKFLVGVRCNVK